MANFRTSYHFMPLPHLLVDMMGRSSWNRLDSLAQVLVSVGLVDGGSSLILDINDLLGVSVIDALLRIKLYRA